MNPAPLVPSFRTEALVVEQDPDTRGQLIQALSRRGYGITTCDTLAEGRQQFDQQRVVVTHANGDTPELRGFVDYVRKCAGEVQPYILAVGEAASPSGLSANRLGLNDFLATPFDEGKLTIHMEAIAVWLNGNGQERAEEAGDGPRTGPDPGAAAPRTAAVLGHYCPMLLDQLPQAIAMFDTELRYLVANRHYVREFGLAGHPIIGRSHYELFPDLHETWRQLFDRALAGEVGRIDEDLFRRTDGSSDWVRWEVRPWLNEEGERGGVVLTQEVITAQKRAERRQRFAQNLTQSLFDSQTLPALLVALDGRVLRSSPAARQCLGLQPTVDGRLLFWTVYPEPESEAEEKRRFESQASAWLTGEPFVLEPADIVVPGSPARILHWTASPHRSSSGQIEAVLLTGTLAGVIEPAPAPAIPAPAAPAPESVLSQYLPFGIVVIERDGNVSYANEAVKSLLGHPFEATAGFEAWLERGAPEEIQREPILREWRDNVWRRQLARVFSLATADGLLKEIELRPRLLSDGRLLVTISDVTEARRSEDALRTSEIKYRSLFQQFPASIALADRAGVIIDANPALEKLTGYTRAELRRLRLHELLGSGPARAEGEVASRHPAALVKTQSGEPVPSTVTIGPICNVAGDTVLQAYFIQPEREGEASPPPATGETLLSMAATPPSSSPAAAVEEPLPLDAWLDLAFGNLRTALMVTDLRGRVRAANPAALQFFGYDRESLLGGGLYRLFRPDDPSGFSREVSERINLFRCWEGESVFVRADGTTGHCLAEVMPATGSSVPGLLCVVRPIFEPVGR